MLSYIKYEPSSVVVLAGAVIHLSDDTDLQETENVTFVFCAITTSSSTNNSAVHVNLSSEYLYFILFSKS